MKKASSKSKPAHDLRFQSALKTILFAFPRLKLAERIPAGPAPATKKAPIMEIRGLTLLQPWAHLVTIGAKRYETRSWETFYSGWVAIHSSTRWTRNEQELSTSAPFAQHCKQLGKIHCGLILGVVRLISCVYAERIADELARTATSRDAHESCRAIHELAFGDFSAGRFAWRLTEPLLLRERLPVKGKLGLWHLSKCDAHFIRTQLGDRLTA